MSILDRFREDTELDLDCIDAKVARDYGRFGNVTSNQAIVLNTLSDHQHRDLVIKSVHEVFKDLSTSTEFDGVNVSQLIVDWMTVNVSATVLPEISGFVLAQTNPSVARSTDETVKHARRLVRLYERRGIPRSRVCIKIPATLEALRACRILKEQDEIRTLATTVFCVEQALAAAEEAGCIYTSPYVNRLSVHFFPGTHVLFDDPTQMPGMKVTAEITRQFRRRQVTTQVLAASLVTLEECVCLSGTHRATLSPAMLQAMASEHPNPRLDDLRTRAIATYQPDFEGSNTDLPLSAHFSVDEPATELKAALARPEVAELLSEALSTFETAEVALREMASQLIEELNTKKE